MVECCCQRPGGSATQMTEIMDGLASFMTECDQQTSNLTRQVDEQTMRTITDNRSTFVFL